MTSRVSIQLLICIVAAGIAVYGLTLPASEPEVQAAEVAAADTADTAAPVPATPASEATAIEIADFDFTSGVTVSAGQPIEVTNLDGAPHTVTSVDGLFDTGTLGQNEAGFISAPSEPGTYAFFCAIHPSMVGELTVQP